MKRGNERTAGQEKPAGCAPVAVGRAAAAPGRTWLRQFIGFGFVGVTGIVVDDILVFRVLLELGVRPELAQAFSWVAGMTNNYTWNRLWTFRGQGSREKSWASGRYLKFAAVALGTLVIRTFLFVLLRSYDPLGLPGTIFYLRADQVYLAGVIFLVFMINFLGAKYWAFR